MEVMIVMVVLLSDHGRPELGGGDDYYGCVVIRSQETGTGWR